MTVTYLATGGIIDNLNQAILSIQNYQGATTLNGDILYEGNRNQWIRFANSLKIKYLMRISNVKDVASDLQNIFDENNFIEKSADNAIFDFTATPPNNFRMSTARVGDYNLFIMSETIEEILTNLNDPRQEIYFRPTGNDPTDFAGLLNGPDPSQLSISVGDFSLSGTIFRENTGDLKANFLTSFEVTLLLAEAAERGLINADAKTLYDKGVEQAFEFWGTSLPSNYLTSGNASYNFNGANPLEQIITQKWLGNILNGYEGWIDYRRTGFPKLKTISASLNNDLLPSRMPYPTTEASLNSVNYSQATSNTNDNSINAKVWWDN